MIALPPPTTPPPTTDPLAEARADLVAAEQADAESLEAELASVRAALAAAQCQRVDVGVRVRGAMKELEREAQAAVAAEEAAAAAVVAQGEAEAALTAARESAAAYAARPATALAERDRTEDDLRVALQARAREAQAAADAAAGTAAVERSAVSSRAALTRAQLRAEAALAAEAAATTELASVRALVARADERRAAEVADADAARAATVAASADVDSVHQGGAALTRLWKGELVAAAAADADGETAAAQEAACRDASARAAAQAAAISREAGDLRAQLGALAARNARLKKAESASLRMVEEQGKRCAALWAAWAHHLSLPWPPRLAADAASALASLWRDGTFSGPSNTRLAFREFGATLGAQVAACGSERAAAEWRPRVAAVHSFWAAAGRLTARDSDISPLMFACSLLPGAWQPGWEPEEGEAAG